MKIIVSIVGVIIFTAGLYCPAFPHAVHYRVENKGISIRVFYAEDDPASYSYHGITLQIKETAAWLNTILLLDRDLTDLIIF